MMVLDASALLAFFLNEPGGKDVAAVLEARPFMSTLNLSEVAAYFLGRGSSVDDTVAYIARASVEVVAFDRDAALDTAALRPRTRHLGLSLGDRACLALALARNLPVLTADRGWAKLDLGVEVRLIR